MRVYSCPKVEKVPGLQGGSGIVALLRCLFPNPEILFGTSGVVHRFFIRREEIRNDDRMCNTPAIAPGMHHFCINGQKGTHRMVHIHQRSDGRKGDPMCATRVLHRDLPRVALRLSDRINFNVRKSGATLRIVLALCSQEGRL